MPDPAVIVPQEPANPGLNYAALREEGLRIVQRLAGDVWTDYNQSDPGVTALEQLCYALTELSYRAEIPFADLLLDRASRLIDPRRQALFPPKRIFPCNPLTEGDYRKLLVDRIPEVRNVWLMPHRPSAPRRGINGLYDIALYVPGIDFPCAPAAELEELRERVRRVYCRHRNLCEDVRSIRFLEPVRTVVEADVNLAAGAVPEAVLAGLLFELGDFLAPELRRRPLSSLIDAGEPPSTIFDGPLLLHGFIADGELKPKAQEIPIQEIVGLLARGAGVASAGNVRVRAGRRWYASNEAIRVRRRHVLELAGRAEAKGGSTTIRLFRNGIEVEPNPARVERELAKLRADRRRTYRLSAQYDEYFALPRGRYRDLEAYSSVQNQFPEAYGINSYALPADATDARRGQAKQLKGYLLVFDQLLADFFAQLAHAKDLFSLDPDLDQTYFHQYLDRSVPGVEPLLKRPGVDGAGIGYRQELPAIVRGGDPVVERRNRFLDVLLALYAEELADTAVWDLTTRDREDADTGERLVRAKLALLRHLIASSHNRGRGCDYLERPSRGNVAGLEIKSRIQLGMGPFDRRLVADLLDEHAVELVAGPDEARPSLRRHADHIEERFAAVPIPAEGEAEEEVAAAGREPQRLTLPEELLAAGGEVEELRVGSLPGETAVSVVARFHGEADWRLLGQYAERESAARGCRTLLALLRALRRHGQQLYVVEHLLLRHGRFRDGGPGDPFVYSFTITAVLSPPPGRLDDPEYRAFARQVLRDNAPAHVVVEDLFLSPARIRDFEPLYGSWRHALRECDRKEIRATSARLRRFLSRSRSEVPR